MLKLKCKLVCMTYVHVNKCKYMYVCRPLGALHYIRLWHDNSGKDPSWFVSFVVVRDLQTNEQFTFLIDDWLAADTGDGLDRIVPAATPSDLAEWSRLMSYNSVHMLHNDHLWLSSFSGKAVSFKF